MRKILLLSFVALLIMGCKQEPQRYFADSPEIQSVKTAIQAYEAGDWDTWRSIQADTMKIYVNSTEPIDANERMNQLKELTTAMSSYGFDHDNFEYIEMVLDKDDETWVYYWSVHHATLAESGKNISIPVHLAIRFVEGKAVVEYAFYDSQPLHDGFAEIEAAKVAADAEAQETAAENEM